MSAQRSPSESDHASGRSEGSTSEDDGSAFLAELVQAMRTTIDIERARVADEIERRREAHLAGMDARRGSEADRIRELADDLRAVDAWAEDERRRVELERERRTTAVRDDLETSLAEHRSKIDREIDRVEAAITAYRAEIDTFFAGIDREIDLAAVARHVGPRPAFPPLEAIANGTVANGAEVPSVGVMDRHATRTIAETWAAWTAATALSEPDEAPATVDPAVGSAASLEPVAAASPAGAYRRPNGEF